MRHAEVCGLEWSPAPITQAEPIWVKIWRGSGSSYGWVRPDGSE